MNLNLNLIKKNSESSGYLDLMRFIAALIVVLSHLGTPDWKGGPLFIWKQISSIGFSCVMIFFVLSGYFISMSVLNIIQNDRWSWKDYLINRITRLWVVLIPALLLTLFWVLLQSQVFGWYYEREGISLLEATNIKYFLSNLFFLQYIHSPIFGLNNPLWSLSFEFWYYILFPCLVLTFKAKSKLGKAINFGLFIGISIFVGWKVILYFVIWLLGAIVALSEPIRLNNKMLKITLIIGTLFAVLAASKAPVIFKVYPSYKLQTNQYVFDLIIGGVTAVLIYLIISFFNSNSNLKLSLMKLFSSLAGLSYTLYLVHYPVVNFMSRTFGSKEATSTDMIWQRSTVDYFIYLPLVLIGILLYAWFISLLSEKHTPKIRKYVSKMVDKNLNFGKRRKITTPD